MIMKAKSQDLQLTSRRTHGLSSSLKAGRLKTQEEPVFQFGSKSIKKKKSPSSIVLLEEFPFSRRRVNFLFCLFMPSTD